MHPRGRRCMPGQRAATWNGKQASYPRTLAAACPRAPASCIRLRTLVVDGTRHADKTTTTTTRHGDGGVLRTLSAPLSLVPALHCMHACDPSSVPPHALSCDDTHKHSHVRTAGCFLVRHCNLTHSSTSSEHHAPSSSSSSKATSQLSLRPLWRFSS